THEVPGGLGIRHDGAAEASDLRLERVPAVEEHDLVPALGDQGVQPVGGEPRPSADDAVRVDPQLIRGAERHDLVAHLHAQLREIEAAARLVQSGALAPFDVRVPERGVGAERARPLLQSRQVPAQSAVDAVRRDQQPSAQPQRLAEEHRRSRPDREQDPARRDRHRRRPEPLSRGNAQAGHVEPEGVEQGGERQIDGAGAPEHRHEEAHPHREDGGEERREMRLHDDPDPQTPQRRGRTEGDSRRDGRRVHGDATQGDEKRHVSADHGGDRHDRAAQRRGGHADDEHRPPGLQHQPLRDDAVPPVDRVAEGAVDGREDAGVGREHGVERGDELLPGRRRGLGELRRNARRQGEGQQEGRQRDPEEDDRHREDEHDDRRRVVVPGDPADRSADEGAEDHAAQSPRDDAPCLRREHEAEPVPGEEDGDAERSTARSPRAAVRRGSRRSRGGSFDEVEVPALERVGPARDEVVQPPGEERAPFDDDHLVHDLLELGELMTGDEHRAAAFGEAAEEPPALEFRV
ncbi:unnamed protein product, partial [Penicillium discolor]